MKGSFTEELINNTIRWYLECNIAYFRKSNPSTSCVDFCDDESYFIFSGKGDIDYYGTFSGRYISFEVKETSGDSFLLSQIKPHQFEILFKLQDFSAVSFVVLNFASREDSCYIIYAEELRKLLKKNKKRIFYEDMEFIGKKVPFVFPGILDFLKILEL